MKVLFVWPNKDSFGFKPIGISLLSAIARREGWETMLFDTTAFDFGFIDRRQQGLQAKVFKPVDLLPYGHKKTKSNIEKSFVKCIDEYAPDCFAFSVLSDEVNIASQLTAISKKYFPELPVIWGGKYPTINPEKTLKECKVDFACIGEGLEAFRDFLNALSSNSDHLYKIPNIWGIKEDTVIKNSIRPLKKNLDDLPFVNWTIFDKSQFYKPYDGNAYKSGDHMLNWGCPYHCTYCINHLYHEMYDNKYHMRRYSVNRIIEELKFLVSEYKLEFFKFHDEDFLMRPLSNLEKLSNAYRKVINLPFVIETNPKSVTKEKVALLKNMNCVSASVAIENGDTYIRKEVLGRVDSEDDVITAFGLLNEAGIRTSSFNMFALPFETRQSYEKTIALNKKAGVLYPAGCFFYPFEGTKLREIAIKEGFYNPNDKGRQLYELRRPALKFKNLSEQELLAMYQSFVLYVKLPEKYVPYIKRGEKCDDLGKQLRQKIVGIYDKAVWKNNGHYIHNGKETEYLLELEKLCSNYQNNK